MGKSNGKLPEALRSDYIVIGAGSAGCVMAARLSEDRDVHVRLLEAGGQDNSQLIKKPGMIAIIHQVDQIKKKFDWGYKTIPQAAMLDRRVPYTRGKLLGGCSSVNGMLYLRGHRANYDSWAAAGCEGWSYDDVLPFYKSWESHHGGASQYHGGAGPIAVTRHPEDQINEVSKAFTQAVADVCGVAANGDFNGAEQHCAGYYEMTARDGQRHSTSARFLSPNQDRGNLTVETDCQVLRLIVENGRATRVLVAQNGAVKELRAEREIILCAGAIGSPQILMLSGIGPAAHLRELGIGVVADLPVGENFHDQLFVPMSFRSKVKAHHGTAAHFLWGMAKEYAVGNTWFARTVFEAGAFLKSSADQPIPDIQLHSLPWGYPDPNQDGPGRPNVDPGDCFTVLPTLLYPKSKGTVRLASTSPNDAPLIDPNFLSEEDDVKLLVRGLRLVREIAQSKHIAGMLAEELAPGSVHTSDAAMAAEVRLRASTVYHPVGSCKMGVDDRAVVDPALRVRGIEGLRVADASIMPTVPGGNTNAPCIMVGERGASLIRNPSS